MNAAARRLWSGTRRFAPWLLAAIVLVLVARQAHSVDWPAVVHALRDHSPGRLLLAGVLALVSYALYATFDLLGRLVTKHALPVSTTLRVAAISYAFNLNFGSLVGGIGLRLRLYTRHGLKPASVARIIAGSMLTNWLGYLWVAGTLMLLAPPQVDAPWMPADHVLRAAGGLMIGAATAYLFLCRRGHVRGYQLPSLPLALVQAALGAANWLLIGAIVWVLLAGRIDYPTVLGVMLLAAVAGVVTHVPANLGVLETVVVTVLGERLPAPELLAAVIAYRAAYYLLPLAVALPAYLFSEAASRRGEDGGEPARAFR